MAGAAARPAPHGRPAAAYRLAFRSTPAVHPFPDTAFVKRALRLGLALLIPWLAGGCATLEVDPLPEPLREPKTLPEPEAADEGAAPSGDTARGGLRTTRAPGVVIQRTVAEGIADRLGEDLVGEPVRVSFHEVPLVSFINEVFGEELGMSFVISPDLQGRTDLVTLKLTEPLPPRRLFATARRVLGEYGVDLRQTEEGVVTFAASGETASRDVPLLVSGRALPEVPATHRTIFQLVPLEVARNPQVARWLLESFDDRDLKIFEDPERNAVLLKGNADMIARALAMIEVLDQPLLRGRHGIVIEPVFMGAGDMAGALDSVLRAEGYQSSLNPGVGGSVMLLALASVDKVVAFAADRRTIEHVAQWARILDTQRKQSSEEAVFTYEVQNTQAEELTGTLNRMLGAGFGAERPPEPKEAPEGGEPAQDGGQPSRAGRAGGRIVVDKNRNMLIFRGTGKEWAEIRSVVEKLDKSVPSVLIEVLIAEITLTDEENTGLEFLVRGNLGSRVLSFGTFGNLRDGLRRGLTLDSSGETRAVLNLFYRDDKVVIRSRPRLLVKSGETASIDVGNEIPVVTQTSEQVREVGDVPNVLQKVTYRKTGVQMEIKPIVQANGLVDLDVSQQLSEARPNAQTSLQGSPTILNRRLSTNLTLRDGGSFLMGGLISGNQSAGETGVPFLGRMPGIGRLFRTERIQGDRTELVIMVTPYVIADHEEGRELTRQIRSRLDLHKDLP